MSENRELYLELEDDQWPFEYDGHDRQIVRAIAVKDGMFYFVRASRDDEFGKAVLIETSGGGVEKGEDLESALCRELKEELGAEAEVICRIGTVSDHYNLIHRHNINNYYLCRLLGFGDRHLTEDEKDSFHLSTLVLSYEDALKEYELCSSTRIGKLIARREIPVLKRAKELLDGGIMRR